MTGRASRRRRQDGAPSPSPAPAQAAHCGLCRRSLGSRVEWHHPLPRSRGGRTTVPVHPICHRTIHASFTNTELARIAAEDAELAADPRLQPFLTWIGGKPADFHAPTRAARP